MRVVVGSDHGGFPIKDAVLEALTDLGCQVLDVGVFEGKTSVDFPDYAEPVGRAIQEGKADRGILLCGSGVGVCVAANKMAGIRACVTHDAYSARQGVEHDGMNVLCLGGRVIGTEVAKTLVQAFVQATFQTEERFLRRMNKVDLLEASK